MNKLLSLQEVHRLCTQSLSRAGLRGDSCEALARTITACERDGCKSHGLFRLPQWIRGLHLGKADGLAEPVVSDIAPSAVAVDACLGFSPLAVQRGMPLLVEKARANGIAILTIRNTFNYSALWHECEDLAEKGLVSMAFVNSKSFMAPAGGSQKLYGTNPMAFGFPRPSAPPHVVFDQASALMARGEISLAHQQGLTLPEGCAVGPDGLSTTDPATALKGAQLPFGSHKGSSIAMMVELMAAGLTGGPFSFQQRESDCDDDSASPTRTSQTVIAIDPVQLGGLDSVAAFEEHSEQLFLQMERHDARIPFSNRHAMRLKSEEEGIEIPQQLFEEILVLSKV